MSDYTYNKKWRRKNPKKWNAMKKRNYNKTRLHCKNNGDAWTLADTLAIFKRKMSDSKLSKLIGRSVQAIQVRRCNLVREASND